MHTLTVPLVFKYKCKHCKQEAGKPETTKENSDFPVWHDCENNVWKKEPIKEEMRKAA
jgi:predicted nucleic acid binding AN1-type Zn finger protein